MKTELTISVTDFKAQCLGLLEQVRMRNLKRLIVTKHGKPIAEVGPPAVPKPKGKDEWNPFAHLVGRAILPEGFDPSAPAYDPEIDGALPGDGE